jgi:hypothetical protein
MQKPTGHRHNRNSKTIVCLRFVFIKFCNSVFSILYPLGYKYASKMFIIPYKVYLKSAKKKQNSPVFEGNYQVECDAIEYQSGLYFLKNCFRFLFWEQKYGVDEMIRENGLTFRRRDLRILIAGKSKSLLSSTEADRGTDNGCSESFV